MRTRRDISFSFGAFVRLSLLYLFTFQVLFDAPPLLLSPNCSAHPVVPRTRAFDVYIPRKKRRNEGEMIDYIKDPFLRYFCESSSYWQNFAKRTKTIGGNFANIFVKTIGYTWLLSLDQKDRYLCEDMYHSQTKPRNTDSFLDRRKPHWLV